MKSSNYGGAVLALFISLLAVLDAHAQFQDEARWVPASANNIVLVRSKKILDSEMGKREHWKTERSKAFRSGAAFFPPTTNTLLVASEIDYQLMEPVWSVCVINDAADNLDVGEISKRINGNIEMIGDKSAVVLPNDSYLVKIDDRTLVTRSPANRQMTARWLQNAIGATENLSPYLTEAVKFAEDNAEIIVAFDLEGALNPDEIHKELADVSLTDPESLDQDAKIMSTIKGIMLGINVSEKITGAIKIDFGENPAGLSKDAKPILLHALKKNGLMIDDLENWSLANSGGNQLLMSGPLSAEGLHQITSLIRQPIREEFFKTDSSEAGQQVNMATRSQQYFGDIQHINDQLRAMHLNNMRTYARWFDRYSREIDGLSVLGVDEVCLQYGAYVANSFRDMANSLRGSDLSRTKSVANQGSYGRAANYNEYGRYGFYDNPNINERNRIIASNLGTEAGANQAKTIMEQVDSETAKVREAMSLKYKVNF